MRKWQPLDRYAQDLIQRIAGEKYHLFVAVFLRWKQTVGTLLAEKSHPIRFEKSVLYVAVENNSWMQELSLLKSRIIQKYKTEHKIQIREIVFLIRNS